MIETAEPAEALQVVVGTVGILLSLWSLHEAWLDLGALGPRPDPSSHAVAFTRAATEALRLLILVLLLVGGLMTAFAPASGASFARTWIQWTLVAVEVVLIVKTLLTRWTARRVIRLAAEGVTPWTRP